ncbi:Tannase and feruloyl esterase [compost metagenome]
MKPDGSVNETLWKDFSERGIHEQALKTKALATAYYSEAPRYSYWDGGSTGGRQGMKLAQTFPNDFDGIIANYPAIYWSRFLTADLYPQIVFQRDLKGKPLTRMQQDLASNAAIESCDVVGGEHLGYILDQSACHYDPTKDKKVLCVSAGGTNSSSDCLNFSEAQAMNKIWYGMTRDGSVPDPKVDNGWHAANQPKVLEGNQRWFGFARGTSLWSAFTAADFDGVTSPTGPFGIASDQVAVEMGRVAVTGKGFINTSSSQRDQWKELTYNDLSEAYDKGLELQNKFSNINTESTDLSAFKARGGKLMSWHGLNDELIMPQGSINYYERVASKFGGYSTVASFFRLYLVPGLGHLTPNGTSNPKAAPPDFVPGQMYAALTDWVENGAAPKQLTLKSKVDGVERSMPICAYPAKITYLKGDPKQAESYSCK